MPVGSYIRWLNLGSYYVVYALLVNPQRTCMRVTVVILCASMSVCMSSFSNLPYRAIRHQTRGISGYSTENAAKLKSGFL